MPDYQELTAGKTIQQQISEWITQRMNPTLDQIALRRSEAVHKADIQRVGDLAGGLLMEVGRWRAEARRELTRAKAQQMRNLDNTVVAARTTEGRTGTAQAKQKLLTAELNEVLADWQYTVDVLEAVQDALRQNLTFFQTSLRSMREDEFDPQGGNF